MGIEPRLLSPPRSYQDRAHSQKGHDIFINHKLPNANTNGMHLHKSCFSELLDKMLYKTTNALMRVFLRDGDLSLVLYGPETKEESTEIQFRRSLWKKFAAVMLHQIMAKAQSLRICDSTPHFKLEGAEAVKAFRGY